MRLQVRWWHWIVVAVIAVVVAVGGTASIIRGNGLSAWRAYEAAMHAAGRATDLHALVAGFPSVDEPLQQRWWAWSTRFEAAADTLSEVWIDYPGIVLEGAGLPPEAVVALETHAALHADLRALIREPGLRIGLGGFAPIDARHHPDDMSAWRYPSLMAAREAVALLRHDLLLGGDRAQAARDLLVLRERFADPRCLLDAMITISVDAIRDQAFLLAVLDGVRGPEIDRWLAEPADQVAAVAAGLETERVFLHRAIRDLIAEIELAGLSLSGGSSWRDAWRLPVEWTVLPGEGAQALNHLAATIDRLRGQRAAVPPGLDRMSSVLVGMTLPGLLGCVSSGGDAAASHRLTRLAARLVVVGGALPVDEAAFDARFPQARDPGGDHLRIRYERLAPRRFRLSVDPLQRGPDYLDAATFGTNNEYGEPPSSRPLVQVNRSIELRLPSVMP